jgi:hypothetical protein
MQSIHAMWMLVAVLNGGGNSVSIFNFRDEASCEIVREQVIKKLHLVDVACFYVPPLDANSPFEQHDHEHK